MSCPNHVPQATGAPCNGGRGCDCPCAGCGVQARKELYNYINALNERREKDIKDLKEQFERALADAAKERVQGVPR